MRTVREIINQQAERYTDKAFLFAPESRLELTYQQLRLDSEALGKHLTKMGLKKGDKVSYMLHNGYQTAKLFLGALYSGFVVVPINLLAQPSHLEYVVVNSDTKVVFAGKEQKELLEAITKRVPRQIQLVFIDVDSREIFPEEDLAGISLAEVSEDDPAQIQYTSGTTGLPKGVVLTHKNMVTGGKNASLVPELTDSDRALCSLPIYHINAQVVTTIGSLISGGSVVMPHRFLTSNFWQLVSDFKCTWFSVVPTIMSYLLNAADSSAESSSLSLSQLRFGRSASAPLPPALEREFETKFNVCIVQSMGLSETAGPVFGNPLQKKKYGSVGIPLGNEVAVADEDGHHLPPGQPGEILVRGNNVMKEYYKAPELTAGTVVDGWLDTGDYGYRDEEGYFFLTGRLSELIKKGGKKIAPAEIDAVLYRHPCILEAAAIGVPDDRHGQEIEACVVLKPGTQASEREILDLCVSELGEFKAPRRLIFMDSLPKGPSGKIQRLALGEKESSSKGFLSQT
jgi:long-chain acyl-CoA synthetase